MAKASKRVRANSELIKKDQIYSIEEALDLLQKTANTKFVGSVEVHIRTGIDPKKTDQAIRGTIQLPHGTGKVKRVAAFVSDAKAEEAKSAGAALVGGEDLIRQIKETEKTDFDVAVAEPAMMKHLASVAKILGTRGLMPNPKIGTVSDNVAQMIKEIAGGKINFKNDDNGNVHQIIGKTNFTTEQLHANYKAFMGALNASKPAAVKKSYLASITLNATMGPGIRVKA
jgi:large subunit ribosomal protein L1